MLSENVALAILISLVPFEVFAALHHIALALRAHRDRRLDPEQTPAVRQVDLLTLQLASVGTAAVVLAIRFARGSNLEPGIYASVVLAISLFAAVVYWKYPDAAPVAVPRELLDAPALASLMNVLRYVWASLASLIAVVAVVALIVSH